MSLRHIIMAAAGHQNMTTVRFNSTQDWTVPPGVTNLAIVTGKGAAGASDYSTNYNGSSLVSKSSGNTTVGTMDWSTVYGAAVSGQAAIAARAGGYGTAGELYFHWGLISSDNKYNEYDYYGLFEGLYINSVGGLTLVNGISTPTSGTITYAGMASSMQGWEWAVNYVARGGAGGASDGFGKTFAGGAYTGSYPSAVGGAAPLTTYTNVAVTPGATHTVTVASGGYVEINYLA